MPTPLIPCHLAWSKIWLAGQSSMHLRPKRTVKYMLLWVKPLACLMLKTGSRKHLQASKHRWVELPGVVHCLQGSSHIDAQGLYRDQFHMRPWWDPVQQKSQLQRLPRFRSRHARQWHPEDHQAARDIRFTIDRRTGPRLWLTQRFTPLSPSERLWNCFQVFRIKLPSDSSTNRTLHRDEDSPVKDWSLTSSSKGAGLRKKRSIMQGNLSRVYQGQHSRPWPCKELQDTSIIFPSH